MDRLSRTRFTGRHEQRPTTSPSSPAAPARPAAASPSACSPPAIRSGSVPAPARRRSTGTTTRPGPPPSTACGRLPRLPPRPRGAGRGRDGRRAADLAVRAGAARSSSCPGRGEAEAQRAEQLVQRPTRTSRSLRCAWFAQNFSESFLPSPCRRGARPPRRRRRPRAVRRRRRHRRRRRRRVDRGRPRRRALRADRPAPHDVRPRNPRDRRRDRPAGALRVRAARRVHGGASAAQAPARRAGAARLSLRRGARRAQRDARRRRPARARPGAARLLHLRAAKRPPPVPGRRRDERADRGADRRGGRRLRADGRRLVRLLRVRDERAGASRARRRDPGDAGDQSPRAQAAAHARAVRHGGGVRRADGPTRSSPGTRTSRRGCSPRPRSTSSARSA